MTPQTGHIGINVTNLQRSEEFYRDVFGLTRLGGSSEEGKRFAFLGDGQKLTLTLWEQSAARFEANRPGLHHLSFQVESADAVRAAEQRLKQRGIPLLHNGVVAHAEGADSGGIFFEDPDGIRLEIFAMSGLRGENAPSGGAPACGFF